MMAPTESQSGTKFPVRPACPFLSSRYWRRTRTGKQRSSAFSRRLQQASLGHARRLCALSRRRGRTGLWQRARKGPHRHPTQRRLPRAPGRDLSLPCPPGVLSDLERTRERLGRGRARSAEVALAAAALQCFPPRAANPKVGALRDWRKRRSKRINGLGSV